MKVTTGEIEGLKVLQLDVWKDHRGFFVERFQQEKFRELGMPHQFVQDNHSRSAAKVLRGLHYQKNPDQGKLVGVLRGRIWDVAVDIRPNSPTFGKWFSVELSDQNGLLLWVPGGFAHGFCVLGDEPADVMYKVDTLYNSKAEGGIRWNDPELNIQWPFMDPVVSDRDEQLATFAEYRKRFEVERS